jgi:hypothetical protein
MLTLALNSYFLQLFLYNFPPLTRSNLCHLLYIPSHEELSLGVNTFSHVSAVQYFDVISLASHHADIVQ